MTQKEVIEAVIAKAISNGWNEPCGLEGVIMSNWKGADIIIREPCEGTEGGSPWNYHLNDLLFSQSFAWPLWGGDPWRDYGKEEMAPEPAWKHHLQALAISEDRIAYLEKHALK